MREQNMWESQHNPECEQQRPRSDCTYVQSDMGLCCSLKRVAMWQTHPTKTQISQCRGNPRGQLGRKSLLKLADFSLSWAEGEVKMYRIYTCRKIQDLDQNFSLKSWNCRKTSPSLKALGWPLQCIHCLAEENLDPWLSNECPAKTLIRLLGCLGWSEYLCFIWIGLLQPSQHC